ncbi:hypothetical protein [Aminobacter aminovorans]|uniref:hypothetical protein n=1 Tax=Aminobacter aminovorans TaxID=83263 RepID=UPI00285FD4DC|nr:hypothetical protein [Aminobacter aminovorans]MDR7220367.1 hypothetical protein [Aminobacter aminovorans]
MSYDVSDGHWIVGGDESRYWSSKARGYVVELPEGWFATIQEAGDGIGFDRQVCTRVASEDDLWDVLRQHFPAGLPADLPPLSVSPAQAEIALHRHDNGVLLAQVNALIESYPYEPVRIWWRKATRIDRTHPYLAALVIELGLSDETVDGLFVVAGAI